MRMLIIMVALAVFGVLMLGALVSDSKWGGNTEDNIDVPTDNAFWNVFGTASAGNGSPTPITVAAPPYITIEAIPNLGELAIEKDQVRISIQTMSGSYSEYVASRPSAQIARPVLYIGSVKPETHGRP